MLRSLGLPELVVIALIILLLFGGKWFGRAGEVAGQRAKMKVLQAKWTWTTATGTNAEAESAERNLGREWAQEILQDHGTVAEAKQACINRLGARLCRPFDNSCPFSYRLIGGPEINAFALPGGFIFVYEGLFDTFQDDSDAIAFVLAHEMAHVFLGHSREQLMREITFRALTARTAGIGKLLRTMILQGYSRGDELEADRRAVSLLDNAGFSPSGGTRALKILGRIAPGEPAFLEYLSSHPPVEERLQNLQGHGSATTVFGNHGSASSS
jgi:predicted Zn-dependent protease